MTNTPLDAAKCTEFAAKLEEKAKEQPWAAVSHRQNASEWTAQAKRLNAEVRDA